MGISFMSDRTGQKLDNCPLCGSHRLIKLFTLKKEQFVRCEDCGLVHINPKPDSKVVLSTYQSGYSHSYEKKADKKIKRAARYVKRLSKKIKNTGRWLDVGCSAGFVVKASQDEGFESHGIDIDPDGLDYAKNKLNLTNVSQTTIENAAFEDASFDIISAYDVIEHVENLHTFTAQLKALLAPDGLIDLITPNLNHWTVPSDLKRWKEIKPSEHLYYFNKRNLQNLLRRHNLKIIQTRFTLKATLKVLVTHE